MRHSVLDREARGAAVCYRKVRRAYVRVGRGAERRQHQVGWCCPEHGLFGLDWTIWYTHAWVRCELPGVRPAEIPEAPSRKGAPIHEVSGGERCEEPVTGPQQNRLAGGAVRNPRLITSLSHSTLSQGGERCGGRFISVQARDERGGRVHWRRLGLHCSGCGGLMPQGEG